MHRITVAGFVTTLALSPSAARAQDAHHVGLVMAYPASLAVVVPLGDRVALRPEVGFTQTSTEAASSFGGDLTTDAWSVGAALSVLLYVQQWDTVRAYVSPRVDVTRSRVSTGDSLNSVGTRASAVDVSGSIGVEYVPSRRFGAFGEVGVGYARTSSTYGRSDLENTSHAAGLRSTVGVMLFF